MTDHTTDTDDSRLLHTTITRLMVEVRGVSIHPTVLTHTELTDTDGSPTANIVDSVSSPSKSETQVALKHNRIGYHEYRSVCEDIMSITTAKSEDIVITAYIDDGQNTRGHTPLLNIIFNTQDSDATTEKLKDVLDPLFRVYGIETSGDRAIAQTDALFVDTFERIIDEYGLSESGIKLSSIAVE